MIIITVDRDGLEKGEATDPIILRDEATGRERRCCVAFPQGNATCIIYDPLHPQANGATVWIETPNVTFRTSGEPSLYRHKL